MGYISFAAFMNNWSEADYCSATSSLDNSSVIASESRKTAWSSILSPDFNFKLSGYSVSRSLSYFLYLSLSFILKSSKKLPTKSTSIGSVSTILSSKTISFAGVASYCLLDFWASSMSFVSTTFSISVGIGSIAYLGSLSFVFFSAFFGDGDLDFLL